MDCGAPSAIDSDEPRRSRFEKQLVIQSSSAMSTSLSLTPPASKACRTSDVDRRPGATELRHRIDVEHVGVEERAIDEDAASSATGLDVVLAEIVPDERHEPSHEVAPLLRCPVGKPPKESEWLPPPPVMKPSSRRTSPAVQRIHCLPRSRSYPWLRASSRSRESPFPGAGRTSPGRGDGALNIEGDPLEEGRNS